VDRRGGNDLYNFSYESTMPYFSCAYERLRFCANKDEAILMTIMDLVIVYGDEGCCVLGTEDVVIIMCKRDASTSCR
jgi:hypothetical protein